MRCPYSPLAVALLSLVTTVAACESPVGTEEQVFVGDALEARMSGELLFLTMRTTPEVHMEALFEGAVVGDAAGCLRLDSPDDATVVWPRGWGFEQRDGTIVILNANGELVARIGEGLRLGGGEVETLPAVLGFTQADRDLAERHCPGKYWIASHVTIEPGS